MTLRPAEALSTAVATVAPPSLSDLRREAADASEIGPKHPRGPRKDRARLRLTDAEWTAVTARARLTGRTVGRYVREVVLGSVPRVTPSLANAEAIRELTRVGNNLNQLAREANADGRFPAEARVSAALDEVVATIRRLG